jgi:hypothetical protein
LEEARAMRRSPSPTASGSVPASAGAWSGVLSGLSCAPAGAVGSVAGRLSAALAT